MSPGFDVAPIVKKNCFFLHVYVIFFETDTYVTKTVPLLDGMSYKVRCLCWEKNAFMLFSLGISSILAIFYLKMFAFLLNTYNDTHCVLYSLNFLTLSTKRVRMLEAVERNLS